MFFKKFISSIVLTSKRSRLVLIHIVHKIITVKRGCAYF